MGSSTIVAVVTSLLVAFIFIEFITKPEIATRSLSQDKPKKHHLYWTVETQNVTRACETVSIQIVNNMFPGPTVYVNAGDTVVIKVTSKVDTAVTIHWHGINQVMTNWADGVAGITQCSLNKGDSYTYEFTLIDQVGTYFWHAHVSWLRATVYGAFIIHSKDPLPYATPAAEIPIVFGEWYSENPITVETNALATHGPRYLQYTAYTMNGWPGPLYNCSNGYTTLEVVSGKTYLLQLVNAALNNNHFFQIANHTMTVVAADGEYVKPFNTTLAVLSPGQSLDVLVTANQLEGRYYFGISGWQPLADYTAVTTPSVGVLQYNGSESAIPITPNFLNVNDTTNLGYTFFAKLRALNASHLAQKVDRKLEFATAIANIVCTAAENCTSTNGTKIGSTMNNVTFDTPTNSSILQSYYYHTKGVYTTDFPAVPPAIVNFTSATPVSAYSVTAHRGAKTLKLKYNQTVQLVLQDLNVDLLDYHPFHLHGHNFYVIGTGFGNYNSTSDPKNFNLVDPPSRNTVGLPAGGWVAIRFTANNPGVWTFHCHIERHLSWGMLMAFITENGSGPNATLPGPKYRLPDCNETSNSTLQSFKEHRHSMSASLWSFRRMNLRG